MNILTSRLIMDFIEYTIILFTSYICATYIFIKSLQIKTNNIQKIIISFLSIIIPIFSAILRINDVAGYRFIFLILTVISFFVLNKSYISIPNSIISVGLSYGIEIISILLIGTLFYLIPYREVNIFTQICSSCFQFLLAYLFMKWKRIKNGFTFLNNKNNFGLGLLISGPIIILTNFQKKHMTNLTLSIFTVGIFISAIGLLIWIRSAFIRHYRKRLKLRAEEYSKIELAEKSKEIEKLSDENTSLSSIIHLDNHIIQTIETELKKLNSPESTEKLLTSINQRNEYVNDVLIKSKNLPSTGSAYIDSVLADLYIKAASRGIDYNLNVDCDINYLLNNLISKDDFEILLREIITNSIVSVENNPDTPGRILINISQPNDIYELTIMDNRITKDDINSISEIIKESNASILTKNFDDNDSFINSITVRFDGLNNNTQ